ncbi:YusW family protein [Metaplanococcus flavidus]|uniref:YusW family protein n=1 Tax=Metaplanococcus flavidus TaxID=569883 RepID=A0ABW3L8D6_9BACL
MIKKKFPIATGFLLSSILILGACGDDDQVTKPITEDATETSDGTEGANPEGGLAEENVGGEVFGFTDFELNVDYADQDDALEISYEEDRDLVRAEYENKLTDENLEGNEAFDKIEQSLAELELTADMPDEEVISKVTEVFSIEPDYESIEIEVTYPEGTDKDYEASGN